MGSAYARVALGLEAPRVGLLSVGEEESKGNELTREAHQLLKDAPVNFIGNVEGRDVYAGLCASCHPAVTHTGPTFTKSWAGKKLSELFGFLRERMPKNEPGSLTEQEYVDVMSYMLRMNGMPTGIDELPADSVALMRIKIDSSRVAPPE